jgi:ankyrin repeat protein
LSENENECKPLRRGDYDARTPFHLAAAEGKLKVVDYLLSVGAEINIRDRWAGAYTRPLLSST